MKKILMLMALALIAPAAALAQSFSTALTGAAEVPGPGDADGSGFAVLAISGTNVTYFLGVNAIATPTVAHIHRGTATEAGPIVVDLAPTWNGLSAVGTVPATQTIINEILGNPAGFYVNVHNGEFPNGAIRGQLVSPGGGSGGITETLALASGRFRVTLSARDTLRTGATGPGLALPENDLFGFFAIPALTNNPDNPEVFVKILDGRTVNGFWWVFYGHLTDLEYTITVTDTTTGQVKTYRKEAVAGRPGEGGFDTAAF